MTRESIPDDVKRFVFSCIPSVPFLEALLLLRHEQECPWEGTRLAGRLYMSEKAASVLLLDLQAAGLLCLVDPFLRSYRYQPDSQELEYMVGQLAHAYAHNLVAVSNLIHSTTGKKARRL